MFERAYLLGAAGLLFASPGLCSDRPSVLSIGGDVDEVVTAPYAMPEGVTYRRVIREGGAAAVTWFISFGVARDDYEKEDATRCGRALGVQLEERPFLWSGDAKAEYIEITAGRFATRAEALSAFHRLEGQSGCEARVTASGLYSDQSSGPWVVHVVEIDPGQFDGGMMVGKTTGAVAGRGKVSDLARQFDAIVAINGGYFVMEPTDGIVGEPTSLSIFSHALQSEPKKSRPWILFGDPSKVGAEVRYSSEDVIPMLIWSDGQVDQLDGVNRSPHLLRDCGVLSGGVFSEVWHDETCPAQNQLVVLNSDAGFALAPDDTTLMANIPITTGCPGCSTATGTMTVIATGERRASLNTRLQRNLTARVSVPLLNRAADVQAVSGGPALLRQGLPVRNESNEGWPFMNGTRAQANNMHRFVTLRAPRTAVGTRADGGVVLVVVDGWRFADDRQSAMPMNGGATIEELRSIMADLGVVDAINLDGGGSSVLVIDGAVVSNPSDKEGERAVGDAIVLVPHAG